MIKEYIRKQFNKVLALNGLGDCQDSTSVLTTKRWSFRKGNKTEFGIDIAIVCKNKNGWHRLIHQKTGLACLDRYYWNEVKDSADLEEKAGRIKLIKKWNEVRDTYRDKKNMYLCRNDNTHPSFIVYIESVNEIYNKYFFSGGKRKK